MVCCLFLFIIQIFYKHSFIHTQELLEIKKLLDDNSTDSELKKLAKEEYENMVGQIKDLEESVVSALIPKDLADERSAVLEVRAGKKNSF